MTLELQVGRGENFVSSDQLEKAFGGNNFLHVLSGNLCVEFSRVNGFGILEKITHGGFAIFPENKPFQSISIYKNEAVSGGMVIHNDGKLSIPIVYEKNYHAARKLSLEGGMNDLIATHRGLDEKQPTVFVPTSALINGQLVESIMAANAIKQQVQPVMISGTPHIAVAAEPYASQYAAKMAAQDILNSSLVITIRGEEDFSASMKLTFCIPGSLKHKIVEAVTMIGKEYPMHCMHGVCEKDGLHSISFFGLLNKLSKSEMKKFIKASQSVTVNGLHVSPSQMLIKDCEKGNCTEGEEKLYQLAKEPGMVAYLTYLANVISYFTLKAKEYMTAQDMKIPSKQKRWTLNPDSHFFPSEHWNASEGKGGKTSIANTIATYEAVASLLYDRMRNDINGFETFLNSLGTQHPAEHMNNFPSAYTDLFQKYIAA